MYQNIFYQSSVNTHVPHPRQNAPQTKLKSARLCECIFTKWCISFCRVDSSMANLHIENFIDTVTINCKCSLQPIHFYISAKLQKTNGFSRHLGGPWGIFMVNLKVLSWILHAWTTRQKQYRMIQHVLMPTAFLPCWRTPCSLLALSRRWLSGCQI